MKKLTIQDAETVILALQDEIRRSPESRYNHRLHGILLIAQGMSGGQLAQLLGAGSMGPCRAYVAETATSWPVESAVGSAYHAASESSVFHVGSEWIKEPRDVTPLALFPATLPDKGPTGQSYSLLGRGGN